MLKTTLTACLAKPNSDGGIYGRTLELVTEDSASGKNETAADGGLDSSSKPVFAYLANYHSEPYALSGFHSGTPLIGPITFMPKASLSSGENIFYLLPSLTSQALALVEFLATTPTNVQPKIAIVHGNRDADRKVTEAIQSYARQRKLGIPLDITLAHTDKAQKEIAREMSKHRIDAVIFLGDADLLLRLGQYLEHDANSPKLLALLTMIGRSVLDLPKSVAAKTYLATPFSISDPEALKQLSFRLHQQNIELINPGLQAAACAAVDIFAEAAKQCGRRLTKAKLINAIEHIHDFSMPLMPDISFPGTDRVGNFGAFVVGISADQQRFIPIRDWITPTR
jgi:ABC-type branched-subunit amino acid transport system substrate-binding protein